MITNSPSLHSLSPTLTEEREVNLRNLKIRVVTNSNETIQTIDHCLARVKSWILNHPVLAGLLAGALITGSLIGIGLGVGLGTGIKASIIEKQCLNETFYFNPDTIITIKETNKDRKQIVYCGITAAAPNDLDAKNKYSKLELLDCQLEETGSMNLTLKCFQKETTNTGKIYITLSSKNFTELKSNLIKSQCIANNPDLSKGIIPCRVTV